MKNSKFIFSFFAAALLVISGFAFNNIENTSTTYSISGQVVYSDTKEPANGTTIDIYDNATSQLIASGYTDVMGYYYISGIQGGVDAIIIGDDTDEEEDYVATWYPGTLTMTCNHTNINIALERK